MSLISAEGGEKKTKLSHYKSTSVAFGQAISQTHPGGKKRALRNVEIAVALLQCRVRRA